MNSIGPGIAGGRFWAVEGRIGPESSVFGLEGDLRLHGPGLCFDERDNHEERYL